MADKKKYKYEQTTFVFEGKQYKVYGKSLSELHEKVAAKKHALVNGLETIGRNMSVKEYANEWLAVYKEPEVNEGQYQNYKLYIDKVIVPAIGHRRLRDVKDIELQRILNERKGKSKSDLSKVRMIIKAMFTQAHASRLISFNPSALLRLPAAEDGTHRSMTAAERKLFLDFSDKHHGGLWVKLSIYCGVRPGEARALDWRHVDFKSKTLCVELAMKAATKVIGKPKSAAGVRSIPIPDDLMCDLERLRGDPFDPIFTQVTTGNRHTKQSMYGMWRNYCRELDIANGAKVYRNRIIVSTLAPDLDPYCMRHTYGTNLQDAGVSINVAKYLLGHSDIKTTANIYTHTSPESISDAAEKINAKIKRDAQV